MKKILKKQMVLIMAVITVFALSISTYAASGTTTYNRESLINVTFPASSLIATSGVYSIDTGGLPTGTIITEVTVSTTVSTSASPCTNYIYINGNNKVQLSGSSTMTATAKNLSITKGTLTYQFETNRYVLSSLDATTFKNVKVSIKYTY